ncbi:MAG: hypothetical protein ABIM89_05495 [Mycobacteriales bacterium]
MKIAGVFTSIESDTGKSCQRAGGHPGPHRWSGSWEGWAPVDVEAAITADYEKWDKPDD